MTEQAEVSIRLRPLPSSQWLTHDRGSGTSIVCIKAEAEKHPGPLTIIGVRLNGAPLRHRVRDDFTVIVSPRIPLEGDYLEVCCLSPVLAAPISPLRAPTGSPLGGDGYGLQARHHIKETKQ